MTLHQFYVYGDFDLVYMLLRHSLRHLAKAECMYVKTSYFKVPLVTLSGGYCQTLILRAKMFGAI